MQDGQDFRDKEKGAGIPGGEKGMPNAQRGVLRPDHRGPAGDVAEMEPGPFNWPQRRRHQAAPTGS